MCEIIHFIDVTNPNIILNNCLFKQIMNYFVVQNKIKKKNKKILLEIYKFFFVHNREKFSGNIIDFQLYRYTNNIKNWSYCDIKNPIT